VGRLPLISLWDRSCLPLSLAADTAPRLPSRPAAAIIAVRQNISGGSGVNSFEGNPGATAKEVVIYENPVAPANRGRWTEEG
jgi:hypothetical protein